MPHERSRRIPPTKPQPLGYGPENRLRICALRMVQGRTDTLKSLAIPVGKYAKGPRRTLPLGCFWVSCVGIKTYRMIPNASPLAGTAPDDVRRPCESRTAKLRDTSTLYQRTPILEGHTTTYTVMMFSGSRNTTAESTRFAVSLSQECLECNTQQRNTHGSTGEENAWSGAVLKTLELEGRDTRGLVAPKIQM